MLKKIKDFYKLTKISGVIEDTSEEAPITHTYIFRKSYPRLPSVKLSQKKEDDDLEFLLDTRESHRTFNDTPIRFEELSSILKSCRIVDKVRNPEKRTYPSAGARFPVEIYLISFNVENLEKGAYHYNITEEKLELLLNKDLRDRKREIISPYLENPAATIIFTSVISRSEVKYGYKSYPFSFIEAGHMGQNILLTATKFNIGACPVSGFVDNTLKTILDLTNGEIPIYAISLGRKGRIF